MQFLVDLFYFLNLFQFLHLKDALGRYIQDLNVSIFPIGNQADAQVLEYRAEMLVVGLFLRLIFFEFGQNGIEFDMQVIGFRSVKLDRVKLAVLVLLDVVEKRRTFLKELSAYFTKKIS